MVYQINLTGQEIDERLQNIGTDNDAASANGSLYARIKKNANDINDHASKLSSGTLRDLYISAGAVYNEATGFYELNGLTDITEEQMRVIYNYVGVPQTEAAFAHAHIRTNLFAKGYYNGSLKSGMFFGCDYLETAMLGNRQIPTPSLTEPSVGVDFSTGNGAFQLCPRLRTIYGSIAQYNNAYWGRTFEGCFALQDVRIRLLKSSIEFKDSPNLSKDSVLYMIENANPPSGAAAGSITITLHPTAYARLKDDADIVAALEAKEGIVTLVSA